MNENFKILLDNIGIESDEFAGAGIDRVVVLDNRDWEFIINTKSNLSLDVFNLLRDKLNGYFMGVQNISVSINPECIDYKLFFVYTLE